MDRGGAFVLVPCERNLPVEIDPLRHGGRQLVRATQPDSGVNVDNLLKESNALRFSEYGDRLTQFFG